MYIASTLKHEEEQFNDENLSIANVLTVIVLSYVQDIIFPTCLNDSSAPSSLPFLYFLLQILETILEN